MSTLETIMNRRSIRRYNGQRADCETIHTVLSAGMAAPTAVNARDWSFIVADNPQILNKMADANGRPAEPLRGAAFGILICGDLSRSYEKAKDYWVVDASLAAENMTLAAHALGLGSVMLGTWPQAERVEKQQKLFSLPEDVVPLMIIAFGWPADPAELESPRPDRLTYEPDRVHFNKW